MKTMISILAFAILATASPLASTGTPPKTIGEADKSCGSNVVSCCNPTNEASSSGLLSVIAGPILGNGCLGIGVDVLSLLSNVGSGTMCGDNSVSCCSGNKNTGLIVVDLQCTSL